MVVPPYGLLQSSCDAWDLMRSDEIRWDPRWVHVPVSPVFTCPICGGKSVPASFLDAKEAFEAAGACNGPEYRELLMHLNAMDIDTRQDALWWLMRQRTWIEVKAGRPCRFLTIAPPPKSGIPNFYCRFPVVQLPPPTTWGRQALNAQRGYIFPLLRSQLWLHGQRQRPEVFVVQWSNFNRMKKLVFRTPLFKGHPCPVRRRCLNQAAWF
jgi:hypothetical protein